jgi:hypothetical protein
MAASPGPWSVARWNHMVWVTGSEEVGPLTMDCSNAGIAMDPCNWEGGHADAEHMASWPPPVAIEIARWLRAEADVVDSLADKYGLWLNTTRGHGALTVAAAYLRVDIGPVTDESGPQVEFTPVMAPWSWN